MILAYLDRLSAARCRLCGWAMVPEAEWVDVDAVNVKVCNHLNERHGKLLLSRRQVRGIWQWEGQAPDPIESDVFR